jgi:hypothetical protein
MSYPTKYQRQYDYVSYQNANPSRPLPATKVNADYNAVAASLEETIEFLKTSLRSDGALANESVGPDQLTTELKASIGDAEAVQDILDARDEAVAAATSADASSTAASGAAITAASSASEALTSASGAAASASAASGSATSAAASATVVAGSQYAFDTITTMADPGVGKLRFNNAAVASVAALAFDAQSSAPGNPDISAFVATWGASTNAVKGTIVIRKLGSPATFATFSVTGAVTNNTGWLQVPVSYVAGSGSFSASDSLSVQFSRSGDSGAAVVDDVTRRTVIENSIWSAKATGQVLAAPNRVSDGYGGNDGINVGASSGYSLDTGNKRVINTNSIGTETLISAGAGTIIASNFGTRLSAAFDGNTSQALAVCAVTGANGFTVGRVGKDYGAGNAKYVTGMNTWGASDGGYLNGFGTATITLKASNTDPTTNSWVGTTIGSIMPFANSNATNAKSTLGNVNTTAYRYVWVEISGTDVWMLAEVQFLESVPTPANIVLVEKGYDSLDFVPSTLQVSAVVEAIDAAVLNTDVTLEVSRDNGVTWSAAALVQYHTLATKAFVESAAISVTGQPSGSKPAFRYKTLNNKRVYLHGVSLVGA